MSDLWPPEVAQCGAVSDRQCNARAQLGRCGSDLGIPVRAAALRLCLPALEGTLRPGPAVPLRRRYEILSAPAGLRLGPLIAACSGVTRVELHGDDGCALMPPCRLYLAH